MYKNILTLHGAHYYSRQRNFYIHNIFCYGHCLFFLLINTIAVYLVYFDNDTIRFFDIILADVDDIFNIHVYFKIKYNTLFVFKNSNKYYNSSKTIIFTRCLFIKSYKCKYII